MHMSARMIFILTALSGALITGAVFFLIGKNEEAARNAAARFATALVHNDRHAAPKGAREYVTGVRAYLGPVAGAEVIGTHNKHAGSGDSARTFPAADVLVRSKRGPAVLELVFDNGGIASEEVTSLYELDPEDAPALAESDRGRLASAFAERGGIPANEMTFNEAVARTQRPPAPRPVAPRPVAARPAVHQPPAALQCVQNARGDVEKLLDCAR
jgi:hypothetical protein